MQPLQSILAALVLGTAGSGCGKSGPVPTYPVRGSVFVNDQPAKGAIVSLVPIGAARGDYLPQGIVHEDGTFTLTSFNPGDGAPEGEYAVRIEWREAGRPQSAKKGLTARKDKFGGRYSSEKSGFRVTVRAGDNELPPYQLAAPK